MSKWVYKFGDGQAEGKAEMRELLGGKGANLAEMSNLGLPVPPGFTITTEVCTAYYDNNESYPDSLADDVAAAVEHVERYRRRDFRRCRQSTAGLGPLRRPRLDAGDDGHGTQSRPQRCHGRGSGPAIRQ